jgi:hypothetical protein
MILPDKTASKNIYPVRIEYPDNKDYINRAKLLASFPAAIAPDLPVTGTRQPDLKLDGYIMIEPVTIKAPPQPVKPRVYVDRHSKMYQSTSATTWYRKDFGPAFSFEDILYKYNPYKLQGSQVFLRQSSPYISGGNYDMNGVFRATEVSYPALFVVDNNPIGTSFETIATMSSSQIASVTFLKGVQGVPMYCVKARGGIVFVTTITGSGFTDDELSRMDEVRRNDDLLKQVRVFRTEIESYIPAKEEVAIDHEFKFRPTILWQDNVLIDESGTIKIKYPNNLVKGTAMVIVNGISFTNLIGSERVSYEVK